MSRSEQGAPTARRDADDDRSEADCYDEQAGPVAMLRFPVTKPGRTGWHWHRRSQLLYATSGLMTVTTDREVWMVPTGHALLIAPRVPHDASCQGPLGLCTAYVEPGAILSSVPEDACRMIRVSPLLDAGLRALAEEGGGYEPNGRTGLLTRVVVEEIALARDVPYALPMPEDPRLRRICDALIKVPGLERDIDGWASEAGLSRRSLTRRFRAETSLSFAEWRRRLRAARAAISQAEGASPLAAADAVGYRSVHGLRAMMARAGLNTSAAS